MVPSGPHRRYNPLLDEWVLCSPQRLDRPWQGETEPSNEGALPRYDPGCYLCPGNARAGGARNPRYASTYVFDNDFPALLAATEPAGSPPPGDPWVAISDGELLLARPESGISRVLCFSPRHDLTLAGMEVADIRRVVETWMEQVRGLGARGDVRHVQVFENKGAAMGCSNPHPHGQIWATASVPTRPARLLATQRRYHERHRRDLLGDYVERELAEAERVVCANDHWAVVVPFWAVWPFETLLVPRRRVPDLPSLHAAEADALAAILKQVLVRYDNLFSCSFPYTMGWQGRPTDGQDHPWWRLHAVVFPPLLRSAAVRKFLVGYEMTAEPQRDLTPEEAAARLRAAPEGTGGAA